MFARYVAVSGHVIRSDSLPRICWAYEQEFRLTLITFVFVVILFWFVVIVVVVVAYCASVRRCLPRGTNTEYHCIADLPRPSEFRAVIKVQCYTTQHSICHDNDDIRRSRWSCVSTVLSLSVWLSVRLSGCLSVCLTVGLNTCLSIPLSAHLTVLSLFLNTRPATKMMASDTASDLVLVLYCHWLSVHLSVHTWSATTMTPDTASVVHEPDHPRVSSLWANSSCHFCSSQFGMITIADL